MCTIIVYKHFCTNIVICNALCSFLMLNIVLKIILEALFSKVKKGEYETKMLNRLKRNFKRKSYINSFCVMLQLLFFFGAGSNFADTIKYNGKVKLLPLPCEQRKKGQINWKIYDKSDFM